MTRRTRRLLMWLAVAAIAAVAIQRFGHFAWGETWRQLLETNLVLLGVATVVNFLSLVAKGWAWQLLLRPTARVGWWDAQKANLVGSAATNVAGSVVGEAARARDLVRSTGTPWRAAIASVVWVRIVEALGLAIFLVTVPALFPLPEALRSFQIVAAIVLGLWIFIAPFHGWRRVARLLPAKWRDALGGLVEMGSLRHLPLPVLLVAVNWLTQWITYDFIIRAVGIHVGWPATFAALIAANLAMLLRLPAGNLGVFQASIAVGLLPFGVAPEDAVAAGIVLQAIQVIPVTLLGGALVGWQGLMRLRRDDTASENATLSPEAN